MIEDAVNQADQLAEQRDRTATASPEPCRPQSADIMKFHNYSSLLEKVTTRSASTKQEEEGEDDSSPEQENQKQQLPIRRFKIDRRVAVLGPKRHTLPVVVQFGATKTAKRQRSNESAELAATVAATAQVPKVRIVNRIKREPGLPSPDSDPAGGLREITVHSAPEDDEDEEAQREAEQAQLMFEMEQQQQQQDHQGKTTVTANRYDLTKLKLIKTEPNSTATTTTTTVLMTEEEFLQQQQQQQEHDQGSYEEVYEAGTLDGDGDITTYEAMCSGDSGSIEESKAHLRKGKRKLKQQQVPATSNKTKLQMVHEFPTLFLGLRRNRIFLVNSLAQSFDLNQRDILLTLRKIKLNESSGRLANVFGLTATEVEMRFRMNVPKVADCLRNFIVWPDEFTMKLNVPINLRQHFNRIHLILNYLVVRVKQNATRLMSGAQISSTYCEADQCHKLKYLIASTLDGCVCFVSRAFGVQTDDEALLTRSGFLTKFKNNTNLIAGKNFHNFEDRLANGTDHDDHENNNGGGNNAVAGGGGRNDTGSYGRRSALSNTDDNFEEIVSEKISKSRTFKLKNYIENILESFQSHQMLSPQSCIDDRSFELLDDIVVIVGALINLQKQEID